ncbi:MAG: hypothetical protein ACQ9MH_24020, partial [Nitrospinales bacterium]
KRTWVNTLTNASRPHDFTLVSPQWSNWRMHQNMLIRALFGGNVFQTLKFIAWAVAKLLGFLYG